MRCGSISLIGTDGHLCGIYPWRCKSWRCPRCGAKLKRAAMARINKGMTGDIRFMTITSPGNEDAAATYALFGRRWKRFYARLLRRFGRIEFVAVVERQPGRGAAHIHIAYRGPYIPQAWLSNAARASGFGPIVDIRRKRGNLARYLGKYLTKDTTDPRYAPPKYFRRIRWSRGWCVWTKPSNPRRWPTWWFADAVPEHAALSAMERNYWVVELDLGDERDYAPWRVVRWFRGFAGRYRHGVPVHVQPRRSRPASAGKRHGTAR